MSGVPVDEATARDFIMVRAALVKRLGGANEALVWSRVYFRVGPDSTVAYEHEGEHWWAASVLTIADETGLTSKQVRTAIDGLIEGGFLVREQHAGYDRTSSYRPVVHLPSGANASAHLGTFHVPSGANVPLIEEFKTSSRDETEKPSRRKPETRLPKTWVPTVSHAERAREKHVDVVAEAEAFRLHAETHDRHAANWNAAFTTWLMKARPQAGSVVPDQPTLDFPLPGWLRVLGIPPEDYLERRDEPGWVEDMQRKAEARAS